jgi:hypothetical protein
LDVGPGKKFDFYRGKAHGISKMTKM